MYSKTVVRKTHRGIAVQDKRRKYHMKILQMGNNKSERTVLELSSQSGEPGIFEFGGGWKVWVRN